MMSENNTGEQHGVDRLVRTLSTAGTQIEPSSDWDQLLADVTQDVGTGSATHVIKRSRLLAAAAAFITIGAGGVALATTADPSPSEISATRPDYVLPGEVVLSENPLIVATAPAPAPRFDTSDLGRQLLFGPVDMIDNEVELSVSRALSHTYLGDQESDRTTTKVSIVGWLEGGLWLIIVTDGSNVDGIGGLPVDENLRERFVVGPHGGSVSGDIVPINSLELIESLVPVTPDYILPFGYSFPNGWVELSQLPIGTSVVSFSDDEDQLWIIPSGGVAAFPAEFYEGERFHLQAFDINGQLIGSVSQTATGG